MKVIKVKKKKIYIIKFLSNDNKFNPLFLESGLSWSYAWTKILYYQV